MNKEKTNIILCGFMASGKTSVAKALSKELVYPYIDTDELIVKESKMSIPEIFDKYGEDYFRDLEHETAKKVSEMPAGVISTGGGMLSFDRNGEVLKKGGTIICLVRDFDKIYEDLLSDTNRPLARDKSKEELKQMYDMRISKYQKYADHTVENNGSIEDCVKKIISIIDGN